MDVRPLRPRIQRRSSTLPLWERILPPSSCRGLRSARAPASTPRSVDGGPLGPRSGRACRLAVPIRPCLCSEDWLPLQIRPTSLLISDDPSDREISMQRVTITIDDELMTELDRIIAAHRLPATVPSANPRPGRGAGIREAAESLDRQRDCVAALVYVYDHAARQLSKRLADTFHDHHELSLASMHAHLDHDSCMEVTILRGKTGQGPQVRRACVIAERGVRHGRVMVVPTDVLSHPHAGGAGGAPRLIRIGNPATRSRRSRLRTNDGRAAIPHLFPSSPPPAEEAGGLLSLFAPLSRCLPGPLVVSRMIPTIDLTIARPPGIDPETRRLAESVSCRKWSCQESLPAKRAAARASMTAPRPCAGGSSASTRS